MNFSKKNYYLKKNNRNVVSKTLKSILPKTLLILLTLIMVSCSSDDDSNSGQDGYYLTAKVDGVDYSTDFVTVSANPDLTDVYIISAVGDTSSFGLTLKSPISTGAFTPMADEETILFYQVLNPYSVWGATDASGSGTITITENTNSYIKGTFSFTGVNPADGSTKVVTEGAFKAQKL